MALTPSKYRKLSPLKQPIKLQDTLGFCRLTMLEKLSSLSLYHLMLNYHAFTSSFSCVQTNTPVFSIQKLQPTRSFETFAFSVSVYAGHVWREGIFMSKCSRIQMNRTCVDGAKYFKKISSSHFGKQELSRNSYFNKFLNWVKAASSNFQEKWKII